MPPLVYILTVVWWVWFVRDWLGLSHNAYASFDCLRLPAPGRLDGLILSVNGILSVPTFVSGVTNPASAFLKAISALARAPSPSRGLFVKASPALRPKLLIYFCRLLYIPIWRFTFSAPQRAFTLAYESPLTPEALMFIPYKFLHTLSVYTIV